MAMTAAPLSAVLRLGLTLRIQGPSVDGSFLPHGQPPGRPSAPGSQEPLCVAHRRGEVSSWGDRRTSTTFEEISKGQMMFFTCTKSVPTSIHLSFQRKMSQISYFLIGIENCWIRNKIFPFVFVQLVGAAASRGAQTVLSGGHGGSNKPSGRGTLRGLSTLCPGDRAKAFAFRMKEAEGDALNTPRLWVPLFTNVK